MWKSLKSGLTPTIGHVAWKYHSEWIARKIFYLAWPEFEFETAALA
jgi:hypothetical protein